MQNEFKAWQGEAIQLQLSRFHQVTIPTESLRGEPLIALAWAEDETNDRNEALNTLRVLVAVFRAGGTRQAIRSEWGIDPLTPADAFPAIANHLLRECLKAVEARDNGGNLYEITR